MAASMNGCVGVLVRGHGEEPTLAPEQRPIGRAALQLADDGIDVVFGDEVRDGRLWGFRAVPGGWSLAEGVPLLAVHDRFASQTYPGHFQRILEQTSKVPFGNPLALTQLCRDKVETQRWLGERGVAMPAIETDPSLFGATLERWGVAFAKPRYGALGKGVRQVSRGDSVATHVVGAVDGVLEPVFLQRAIAPPAGWAGVSLRLLTQRTTSGDWLIVSWIMRRSREDPVVNVARGAEVSDARQHLTPVVLRQVQARALAVAEVLSTHPASESLVELGIDLVLDLDDTPHLIEVNSRPRGRLEVLASTSPEQYADAHAEACARPIRRLWALYGPTN